MLKIGILGADGGAKNGHALGICKILNSGNYDVEIVGLYGDNAEETAALAASQNIDFVAKKPENLLGTAEAVFVLQRNGNRHLACALPFVEAGLPVFVDKPFTCTVQDAKTLIAAARKSGSLLCGGSYVKYAQALTELKQETEKGRRILSGYISFPMNINSPYGGLHFYSHHLIGEMLRLFGDDVQSVTAVQAGEQVVVTAAYRDFPVIMNYASAYGGLHAGIYFEDGTTFMKPVELGGLDVYQCERFLQAVQTGEGDESDGLLRSVIVSNAIEISLRENKTILLKEAEK